MPASEIIADAVSEWLESREDAELVPAIEAARTEWKEEGGRPWSESVRQVMVIAGFQGVAYILPLTRLNSASIW